MQGLWQETIGVKYDPAKHHRRSIRLKGYDYTTAGAYFITICTHHRECLFGEIVDGVMQLNRFGQIVRSYWVKLPQYHAHLQLDIFVVMPNHVHGILVLTASNVGAGFGVKSTTLTDELLAKPAPTEEWEPTDRHGIPEIIRGFKTFSARRINQIRKIQGLPVWQRNYYEHIIRDEKSLQLIQQYIDNNPSSWQQDQLHPNNPFKNDGFNQPPRLL
jgi:putative transposase